MAMCAVTCEGYIWHCHFPVQCDVSWDADSVSQIFFRPQTS